MDFSNLMQIIEVKTKTKARVRSAARINLVGLFFRTNFLAIIQI